MTTVDNGMGVIFDLDGVLVDTSQFHLKAWYDLAEKEGFEMSDHLFYSTFGMQNYQILPMLAKRELSAGEIERMSQWKEERYRELIQGRLELMGGVKTLIEELKSSGFALAIGTSTPRVNLDFMLEQISIKAYIDACVTGEDVSNGKPAPDTFVKAAEKLSLSPGKCAVVEDAVQGVESGKKAGMAVVAVTTTRERANLKQADIIVDSLNELKADDFLKLITDSNRNQNLA